MSTGRIAGAFAIGILIASCGTLEKKSILIDVGDNKQKVLGIMGTPEDRQVQGPREAWQYCVSGAGFGYNDHRIVWFRSGVVTSITSYRTRSTGCTGAIRSVHWESAPDSVIEIRSR